MPRTYLPSGAKKYKKYDDFIINAALQEYKTSKSSLSDISLKYDIPKSVLHRHKTRYVKKHGGQTALTAEEEAYIIEHLNLCSEWGYPLDTYDLRVLVKGYLDRAGIEIKRFKDNLPGPDFTKSFLQRNSEKISLRISQNIKRSRASVSPETIKEYFDELEKTLEGVPLGNVLNYDETNLSDDPGRRKIITKRGAKYPERIMNHSKTSTSLMMAASADGTLLPCYVVYKAKNLYECWREQGPRNCRYNCTSSGWFDSQTFEDWVRTIALPYFNDKPGKKIMIGDNLSSHLSINLIRQCKEKDVHFVFLPANTTHLTQPLDVAFFRSVKGAWRDILFSWKKTEGRNCATIPKSVFPSLLKKLLDRIENQATSNIKAGFMKAGISPINQNKVLERLPGYTGPDERPLNKDAVDESVKNMYREMRYSGDNNKICPKRKKIEVKPGGSVPSAETNAEIEITENTGTDGHQEESKDNKLKINTKKRKLELKSNSLQNLQGQLSKNKDNKMKKANDKNFGNSKTDTKARDIKKNKKEITYLNQDISKKPHTIKTTIESNKTQEFIIEEKEELVFEDNDNNKQLDIESMPIIFDDNFVVQEEIEINFTSETISKQGSNKENIEKETEDKEKAADNIKNKVPILSNEKFTTKRQIKFNKKQLSKVTLEDQLKLKKRENRSYYTKEEDILRDLMDSEVI